MCERRCNLGGDGTVYWITMAGENSSGASSRPVIHRTTSRPSLISPNPPKSRRRGHRCRVRPRNRLTRMRSFPSTISPEPRRTLTRRAMPRELRHASSSRKTVLRTCSPPQRLSRTCWMSLMNPHPGERSLVLPVRSQFDTSLLFHDRFLISPGCLQDLREEHARAVPIRSQRDRQARLCFGRREISRRYR